MCRKKKDIDKQEKKKSKSLFSVDAFRSASGYVCLSIGLLCYFFCWYLQFNCPCSGSVSIWMSILEKVGDVLVIGAVLGFVSNAAMYMGFFREELENIVLRDEYLERRKDIGGLWEKITKMLFQSRFPSISKDLLCIIKEKYFPTDQSVYYKGYTSDVHIEWEDREKEIVKVTMSNNFKVVTETESNVDIPWKSWTRKGDGDLDYYTKVLQYKVNGENIDIKGRETIEGNQHVFSGHISLTGKLEYDIATIIEKRYCLKDDFNRCFRALFIVDDYTLVITHPEDMKLLFTSRGTPNDFTVVSQTKTNLTARYDGLILPSQGYVVSIRV